MSGVGGVDGTAGAGGVSGAGGPKGADVDWGGVHVRTMDDLKNAMIDKMGEKEGTAKFNDMQKMWLMNSIKAMQKTAQDSLARQKRANQG